MQPASRSPATLTPATPKSRSENLCRVDRNHRELKPGPSTRWKIDAGTRGTLTRIEGGAAPRHALTPPTPFCFQQYRPARAIRRQIVEGILDLREPPDQA